MLQQIIDWIIYGYLGFEAASKSAAFLSFVTYGAIKISLLLLLMVALFGFLRTYFPKEKIKKWIESRNKIFGHFTAAAFGAITPFCSCSSIPLFFSFLNTGIPLGISFSFLITSPIINEYLVILMLGFFGWKITSLYIISGLAIGMLAGYLLGRFKLGNYIIKDMTYTEHQDPSDYRKFTSRLLYGWKESKSILKKTWLWILAGVAAGALISVLVPENFIQGIISRGGHFTVPVATLVGIPVYASCVAIVPVAIVLFQKGISLGTALAFMMAASALSIPSFVILKRVMKWRLITVFFIIVALGIVFTGYLFNMLQHLV